MPAIGITPLADAGAVQHGGASFAQTFLQGVDRANTKFAEAEKLVNAFATNENIPTHQVAYALEAARLDFELAMQVRNKLLEAYQQLMNMQI